MADDSNELATISHQLPYISSSGEDQMTRDVKAYIIAIDRRKSSSPVVLPVSNDDKSPIYSLRQIYKNLLILSLAFVLMFTAYIGIGILQSSLNVKNNVGVNSLMITSAFFIVS